MDGQTDGHTKLRWLRRATAVAAVALKNGKPIKPGRSERQRIVQHAGYSRWSRYCKLDV